MNARLQPQENTLPPHHPRPSQNHSMPHPPRIKCLIVDDIRENLIAMEALLQRDDVELLLAESGGQALELLLTHSDVALALLDVQMPEMNGYELAEFLRGSERTRHIPIIFMTAGSRDQHWQFRGYESGAVDFLYKPIDSHMLVNKVNVFFELHRRTQALAHELQERTASLRVNEMFMAVLSHDLRTPLMSMMAAATVLKRQPDTAKLGTLVESMLCSGQRMGRMIEDLLDVTRIRHVGGIALDLRPASLETLVERTVTEMRTGFPDRPLRTTLEGDLLGVWDAERLSQVITNLVGNALQHGDGIEPVEIAVDGRQSDQVTVSVINGGTPIAPDLIPHLFDPFRGGSRPPGRNRGLGLGLFIAHQLVRAHGGTIDVQSQDCTTRFCFTLPRISTACDKQIRL